MPTTKDISTVVLVLQGGGALGAYHVGAYQAMHEAGFAPDWVAGTSIGAITSAVIVGNRPEERVARLDELWDEISWPDGWGAWVPQPFLRAANEVSVMQALLFGQPNFFTPYLLNPYFSMPGTPSATAFYDTSPMLATLRRLCDFDLINSGKTRISLGATNVVTGELTYFDNRSPSRPERMGPEHVLASGSLPPGFGATDVEGEYYWDGGCVSNTPLDVVLTEPPEGHTLVFMIDLWGMEGKLPTTIDEVMWRQKQIQYASRTTRHIQSVADRLNLRRHLATLHDRLPPGARDDPAVKESRDDAYRGSMDIVHIQYVPTPDQVSSSDAEFSRRSIAARRAAGYEDLLKALERAPWRATDRATQPAAVVHRMTAGVLV